MRHADLPDAGAIPHHILDARPPALWHTLRIAELAVAANPITLDHLPGGYALLRLALYARSTASSERDTVSVTLNSDSGANYDQIVIAYDDPITQLVTVNRAASSIQFASIEAANSRASTLTPATLTVHWPADATWGKSGAFESICFGDRDADADILLRQGRWAWRSTAAVHTITLTTSVGEFVAGSRVVLWGLIAG